MNFAARLPPLPGSLSASAPLPGWRRPIRRRRRGHHRQPILVERGHRCRPPFLRWHSRGLASVVEKAVSQWGLPNGYILGEEASGAFIGGLRYGDGTLYTRNAGDVHVFWQGPSLGFDAGADGARTMMLIYNLPRTRRSSIGSAVSPAGLFCRRVSA